MANPYGPFADPRAYVNSDYDRQYHAWAQSTQVYGNHQAAYPHTGYSAGGPTARAVLVGDDGQVYPIPLGSVSIGRGDHADIRLPDVGLSRLHARAINTGLTVEISDAGSTNGTTVNGRPAAGTPLTEGDVIEMGCSRLTYHSTPLS